MMEYQVYKEDTGEIIAWIDPSNGIQIIKDGYGVKAGKHLMAAECEVSSDESDN